MQKIILILALCTSVVYANDNNFDYIWKHIVKFEGETIDKSMGYSHSKFGITAGALKSYNKSIKLNKLTEQQAKVITYKMFYEPNLISFVRDKRIALAMLDWCYNSSPFNATKQMQKMLGLYVDGTFSISDIKYINSMSWSYFISKYYPKRLNYFKSLNKPKYLNGWIIRLNAIKEL